MMDYDFAIGIPFSGVGNRDCYALLMDLYERNFGIKLTNFARPNDWQSDTDNLIEELYEKDGFIKITDWKVKDLRPGDILAMAIMEQNPNHLAVYVGDSTIVHHLYGRVSSAEPWRDLWQYATCFVLRHPDVPDLRPVHPDADLLELLRVRNSSPTE